MNDNDLSQQFGAVTRKLRLEAGLSQEEFAQHCNLHRTYIGTIERGEKSVTISTANKIAKALGTTLSQLFIEMEEMQKGDDDEK